MGLLLISLLRYFISLGWSTKRLLNLWPRELNLLRPRQCCRHKYCHYLHTDNLCSVIPTNICRYGLVGGSMDSGARVGIALGTTMTIFVGLAPLILYRRSHQAKLEKKITSSTTSLEPDRSSGTGTAPTMSTRVSMSQPTNSTTVKEFTRDVWREGI